MTTLDSGPALNVDRTIDGRQIGDYSVPLATSLAPLRHHQSPLCVLRNGDGPSVCVLSGVHPGDTTGTMVLQTLANQIDLEHVKGTLILCPSLFPAQLSNPQPTQMSAFIPAMPSESLSTDQIDFIKHSFADDVLSSVDVIIEIGSGARDMENTAHASVWPGEDAERNALAEEIMILSGAPDSVRRFDEPMPGSIAAMAEQFDTPFVRFDFGRYGCTDKLSHLNCVSAVRNALLHTGVLIEGQFVLNSTRMLEVSQHQCRVQAPTSGLVHWSVEIGGAVHRGNPIAEISDPHRPFAQTIKVDARMNGVLLSKLDTAMCSPHQLLAIVGDEVPR